MVDENIPGEKVTTFDRGQYERLMRAVQAIEESLDTQFLKAGADVRLDETFGARMQVGDEKWGKVVTDFNQAAAAFGGSVRRINGAFSDDWRGFVQSLNEAKDVFEDTDNLASYSAKDFVADYPNLGGGETGGGAPA